MKRLVIREKNDKKRIAGYLLLLAALLLIILVFVRGCSHEKATSEKDVADPNGTATVTLPAPTETLAPAVDDAKKPSTSSTTQKAEATASTTEQKQDKTVVDQTKKDEPTTEQEKKTDDTNTNVSTTPNPQGAEPQPFGTEKVNAVNTAGPGVEPNSFGPGVEPKSFGGEIASPNTSTPQVNEPAPFGAGAEPATFGGSN